MSREVQEKRCFHFNIRTAARIVTKPPSVHCYFSIFVTLVIYDEEFDLTPPYLSSPCRSLCSGHIKHFNYGFKIVTDIITL